jgi:hypothetical protein
MGMPAVQELREPLERRFPGSLPLGRGVAPAVGTGLRELDALLPERGLARGRVTVWSPGGGATAVQRAVAGAVVEGGERAAWVDGSGGVVADFWRGGPLLVRPSGARAALSVAEELLRSGGFALVVVAGCGRDAGREAVRLSRAARSGGASLVVQAREAALAHLRIGTRIAPEGYRWRCDPFGEPVEAVSVRIEVEARTLGWSGRTSLELPVRTYGARLAGESRLVDRRGAPPQARWRRSTERTRRAGRKA